MVEGKEYGKGCTTIKRPNSTQEITPNATNELVSFWWFA
jgi:hypothetical protein